MLLRGRDGSELELHVLGYQFPDTVDDPWEANRLLVALRVVAPAGSWEVADPCLTTYEGEEVAGWLAAVGAGAPLRRLALSEPNVSVRLAAARPGSVTLAFDFELEERPPWGPTSGAHRLGVEVTVGGWEVATAAADLAQELSRFPSRADPPE